MIIYKKVLHSEKDFQDFKDGLVYEYNDSNRPSPEEYPCCIVYSDEDGPWGEYWEFVYIKDIDNEIFYYSAPN